MSLPGKASVVLAAVAALAGPGGSFATTRELGGAAAGAHYFVDCAHGNDSSSGLSPRAAWRSLAKVDSVILVAGDAISFRRGTRCVGVLAPTGSGAPGRPIVADAYGDGAKPQLAGDGARAAVYLHDVDEWELRGLAISNLGPAPQPGQKRNGIWVVNDGLGVAHHYVIEGIDIAGVNSSTVPPLGNTDFENYSKDSGGIMFSSSGANGFDGVLIDRDTVRDANREGIVINGGLPTTGLAIADNHLRAIGGDGIVAVNSTGALIEGNVVDAFNTAGTSFNAGVWGYNSTDATFQFNDVSHGEHGPLDSMAYDIDGANHHLVFQYNLSHDNSGGFLMLCNDVAPFAPGAANGGSVVRYNISQNDHAVGRAVIDAPFLCAWENDISIYNNTVYTKDPRITSLVENTNGSTMHLVNNILEGPGPEALIYDRNGTWQNNLYDGVTCAMRPPDARSVIADPRLVAPGTAESLRTAGGYRLRVGSPALSAGIPVSGDGGRDYFGNPIPDPPNIGAYQGPGIDVRPRMIDLSSAALAPGC